LYLAVGFLQWYEDDKSDRKRQAPLLLIPVKLDRQSAMSRFKLQYADGDITTNLSLQEKLRVDFGIELPDVGDMEDLIPTRYRDAVARAVQEQKRWEVLPNDMVLWFFSFAKFLMYLDLQPDRWPAQQGLAESPLIRSILDDEFRNEPPICGDNDNIDHILRPLDMVHVLDADSSQATAIEEVKRGRNLVIQGPPGTGKSQTIANFIATAVKEGKKVLFVAEKMAALEVVKRRLQNIGLGDMCLELHSSKASKRTVLDQLASTMNLGRPQTSNVERQAAELEAARDTLNRHAAIIHRHLEPSRTTPFQALGELVRLRAASVAPADFELLDATAWTSTELEEKQNLLSDLALHLQELGIPNRHPWRGVQWDVMLPMDIERIVATIPNIVKRLQSLASATAVLARMLHYPSAQTVLDTSMVALFARRLLKAPPMDRQNMADDVWQRPQDIDALLELGTALDECRRHLQGVVTESGWAVEVAKARCDIAAHGRSQ